MKTGLLIIAVLLVVVLLVVGAFALRQSRANGDAAQFAQIVSTLCIQAQIGMSECSTQAAVLYQMPAAATGIPACATEYPAPLASKFGDCVSATLNIPATSAAAATKILQDLDATNAAKAATTAKLAGPTLTANAFIGKFRTDIGHLCAAGRTDREINLCASALYPLGDVSTNDTAINACASIIPPLTRNSLPEDVTNYLKCLSEHGLSVEIQK